MKRMIINAVLALAWLHITPLPSLSQGESNQVKHWYWQRWLNAQTENRRLDLKVAPTAKSTRLRIETDVQAGCLEWKLRDPRGAVRASGFTLAGQISGVADSGELEPLTGQWTLEVKAKGMRGGYKINWVSRLP